MPMGASTVSAPPTASFLVSHTANHTQAIGRPTEGSAEGPLSHAEQQLGEAVMSFLQTWRQRDAESTPNVVHLGGDAQVRELKAALPSAVSLKAWLKQRFSHRVEVRGQSVIAL